MTQASTTPPRTIARASRNRNQRVAQQPAGVRQQGDERREIHAKQPQVPAHGQVLVAMAAAGRDQIDERVPVADQRPRQQHRTERQ